MYLHLLNKFTGYLHKQIKFEIWLHRNQRHFIFQILCEECKFSIHHTFLNFHSLCQQEEINKVKLNWISVDVSFIMSLENKHVILPLKHFSNFNCFMHHFKKDLKYRPALFPCVNTKRNLPKFNGCIWFF